MVLRNIILSVIVLALGVYGANMIFQMKPVAEKITQPNLGALVEYQR